MGLDKVLFRDSAEDFIKCLEAIMQDNTKRGVYLLSNSSEYCKSPAFEEIVSMRYKALEYIKYAYKTLRTDDPAFSTKEFNALSEEDKKKVLKQSTQEFSQRIIEESTVVNFVLPALVHRIVGKDFEVPEEIHGKISELRKFTRQWLYLNMHKYVG